MDIETTSSTTLAKKAKEEQEKESKEYAPSKKIKNTWDYLDKVKELQSLEIKIEEVRKELKQAESRFPDLKILRGGVDHVRGEKYYDVKVDPSSNKILPGKSYDDALDKYTKRVQVEKKNALKQREEASKKRAKQG